jgi:SM-20-related protein
VDDTQVLDAARAAQIAATVATQGWAVCPDAVDAATSAGWLAALDARRAASAFQPARVGRGDQRVLRPDVRTDRILWLDADAEPPLAHWFAAMDHLRLALNRETYLGLFDFESHAATYPPGAFYARHLDQLAGTRDRIVTVVYYLNADWTAADGGLLRLYPDDRAPVDVVPAAGTLVVFLADRFEHEVLPAVRPRHSLTGWFRRRPTAG